MDDTSPLPKSEAKASVWPLPSCENDVIWSPSLRSRDSFGARVCAVESWGGAAESNSRPNKLLAKMKLITKMNNWTYIRVITTTLNDQNHILENCIGSVIYFYILTQVPFVYMERAGFMTCTAASHQGAIKEPAASLFRTCEAQQFNHSRPIKRQR